MEIKAGEIYGKHSHSRWAMYSVLKVGKKSITLQNIDRPQSLFETSAEKLEQSGYTRISQTPYVNLHPAGTQRRNAPRRPVRCPYTLDFLSGRADSEKPQATL